MRVHIYGVGRGENRVLAHPKQREAGGDAGGRVMCQYVRFTDMISLMISWWDESAARIRRRPNLRDIYLVYL
jgi:hypothetical protein